MTPAIFHLLVFGRKPTPVPGFIAASGISGLVEVGEGSLRLLLSLSSRDAATNPGNWSWFPPKDKQMKNRWSHRGDQPVFDKKHGGWKLSGETPELTLKTKTD